MRGTSIGFFSVFTFSSALAAREANFAAKVLTIPPSKKVALIDLKSGLLERAYTKADLNCHFQASKVIGTCLKSNLKLVKSKGQKCISGEIAFEKALVYRDLEIFPNYFVKSESTWY